MLMNDALLFVTSLFDILTQVQFLIRSDGKDTLCFVSRDHIRLETKYGVI